MEPLLKMVVALLVLGLLALAFFPLFLMAFYAESGSQTMNLIGRILFIPYGIFAILALVSFIKI